MVHHVLHAAIVLLILALLGLAFAGALERPDTLAEVKQEGTLVIATRMGPTTFYETEGAPGGIDYDLARAFADHLDVELDLIVADSRTEIYQALASGRAHLAAGALLPTATRREQFQFTAPYAEVERHLVYRRGEPYPASFGELLSDPPGELVVRGGSAAAEYLQRLGGGHPDLEWTTTNEESVERLLYRVWTRELDFTVVDSNELALNQRYYPELRVAFTFPAPQPLAWGFDRRRDDTLFETASDFLDQARDKGLLERIQERYFGHLDGFDYVGARTFLRHITERLPQYRPHFEEAAAAVDVDWRMLAAIGYQESHWNPRAVSPTGVRGLMMLTRPTAAQVGVEDRLDAVESIHGGARYYRRMLDRLEDEVDDPVRTWMALAAYNVGLGHLQDARMLTEERGYEPDSWIDVQRHLPLLAQAEWHSQTQFGYARGWEPVHYVKQVRMYYDLLVRITDPAQYHEAARPDLPRHRPFVPADAGHVALPGVMGSLY